jgi:hypothetical protein
MKRIKKSAILALAAAALTFQSAHAAITINNGDLILGVEDVNSSDVASGDDFEVDLGNATQFTTTQAPEFFTTKADLPDLTGHGFDQFSVVGETEPYTVSGAPSIITSDGTINLGSVFLTQDSAPTVAQSAANLGLARNAIGTVETNLASQTPTLTSSGSGALVDASGTDSYSSLEKGTAFFQTSTDINGSAPLTAGPTSSLQLYLLNTDVPQGTTGTIPPPSVNGKPGSILDLGTFTFIDNPVGGGLELEFVGADYSLPVTPEPSTYALMFLGLGLLVWQAKRRGSSAKL